MQGRSPQRVNYRHWLPEHDQKLRELMDKNLNYVEIAKIFGDRTPTSILKRARKLGWYSDYRFKKYSHNENYFSTPNPINCYFAGILAADGSLSKKFNSLRWEMSSKDIRLLKLFKEETKFTGVIRSYERKKYKKEELMAVSYLCVNSCSQWYSDLERNFNIVPIKTKRLQPPNLTDEFLIWCFIIGYLDGDGFIPYMKKTKRMTLGFVSSSKVILDWIKEQIDKKFNKIYKTGNIPCGIVNVELKKGRNYWYYVLRGSRAQVIFDYLSKFLLPKLKRKWEQKSVLDLVFKTKINFPDIFEPKLIIPDQYKSYFLPKIEPTPEIKEPVYHQLQLL